MCGIVLLLNNAAGYLTSQGTKFNITQHLLQCSSPLADYWVISCEFGVVQPQPKTFRSTTQQKEHELQDE